ncbi:MAG: phosphoribosyl-AMP cyclohydrolase [Candidatus Thorarchaeota archaeon]
MSRVLDLVDFDKGGGLVPVVVQDDSTMAVLTLAYVNREALQRTLETGLAHFYRRSLGRVMMKGETSGHIQKVVDILIDCDNDSLVFRVRKIGPACHLGRESCFVPVAQLAQGSRSQATVVRASDG